MNVASQVQNVSAASEEQVAIMEQIAASSHTLEKNVEELQLSINKFRL